MTMEYCNSIGVKKEQADKGDEIEEIKIKFKYS